MKVKLQVLFHIFAHPPGKKSTLSCKKFTSTAHLNFYFASKSMIPSLTAKQLAASELIITAADFELITTGRFLMRGASFSFMAAA
jgi:hypothetical protein